MTAASTIRSRIKRLFASNRGLTLLLLYLFTAPIAWADDDPGKQMVMGVYSYIQPSAVASKMLPLVEHLESTLNQQGEQYHIELKIYPDYESAIQALAAGEVDFARFGPVSYVIAKERNPTLRLLAMESNGGSKLFNGVIAVPEGSPIRSLQDLAGRRVAFGARQSTTGRFLSQALLVEQGISASMLSGVDYLGRHDRVAFALAAGDFDAGAMNENTFNKYRFDKGLRKLAQFPCVTKPWIARSGLDRELYFSLQQALLSLDDPAALKAIKRNGFVIGSDGDYDMIRAGMQRAVEFEQVELKVANYVSEMPRVEVGRMQRLLERLERELLMRGWVVSFELKNIDGYQESIDQLVSDQMDIGLYGPVSYVMAHRLSAGKVQPLVREQLMDSPEMVIVSRRQEGIADLSGLQMRTFAFGDRLSTEGRYLAQLTLLEAGITADSLAGFGYLGRHDRVLFAVASGQYDAGAARADTFARYGEEKELRVLHRQPSYQHVWLARGGLDRQLGRLIVEILVALSGDPLLAEVEIEAFVPFDQAYYRPVERLVDLVSTFGGDE